MSALRDHHKDGRARSRCDTASHLRQIAALALQRDATPGVRCSTDFLGANGIAARLLQQAATSLTSALSAVEPTVDSNRAQVPADDAGSAAASRRPLP
ncbi:hypothetical protein XhhCFBP4925_07565 [Xanthomonas hortorum pv. hederae]|nr:hypothetical protein XhhCFBP4925_07565 [Xanthomonas hortorum pv. hederae]PUF00618.1 hypothetical protein C7T87_07485 [Xanthomonas hortorum pv. hederae]